MKKRIRAKIAKSISQELSLKVKDDIAYRVISNNDFKAICGITIDTVSFNENTFKVHYFCLCLYLRAKYLPLSFGGEFEHMEDYAGFLSNDIINIVKNKYHKFDAIQNFSDIINVLEKDEIKYVGATTHKWELLAYTHLILGNYNKSLAYLDKIIELEDVNIYDWEQEQIARAKTIKEYIQKNDIEKALETLKEWQTYTINNLKLKDLE